MMYGNPYLPQLQTMQAQLAQLQGNTPQTQSQAISQGYQIQTVKGIAGARAFVIPPSSSVVLMDTDSSVFYVKTTDANGLETVKAYDFTEKEVDTPELSADKFVLKSDFDKFSEKVDEFMKSITAQNAEKSPRGGKTS